MKLMMAIVRAALWSMLVAFIAGLVICIPPLTLLPLVLFNGNPKAIAALCGGSVIGVCACSAVLALLNSTPRRDSSACPRCGYDRRAQSKARCPECGWPDKQNI